MKREFPLAVKRGNVSVKIYFQKSRKGYCTYTVVYYGDDNVLNRVTFADPIEARTAAAEIADHLNRGRGATLLLEGADRLAYLWATAVLAPLEISWTPPPMNTRPRWGHCGAGRAFRRLLRHS